MFVMQAKLAALKTFPHSGIKMFLREFFWKKVAIIQV